MHSHWMHRALELAALGRGHVEPNPMVGCVLVYDGTLLASGYHRQFGGPHAEIEALDAVNHRPPAGTILYVTLEPCRHHGKTPPCTDAIIASGIRHVVVATEDPFAENSGRGLAQLREAGITCKCGVLADAAEKLNAPYFQRIRAGIPWFIAKWAMTLDGRIATEPGADRWISSEQSRAIGHELRGRVDAIVIGRGTLEHDDPLLTARPAGPRIATRIVLASRGLTQRRGQILTAPELPPTVIVVDPTLCPQSHQEQMRSWGCQVLPIENLKTAPGLNELARHLGALPMTNVLVEGGPTILRAFAEARLLREYHLFLAPTFHGTRLESMSLDVVGGDVHWHLGD